MIPEAGLVLLLGAAAGLLLGLLVVALLLDWALRGEE